MPTYNNMAHLGSIHLSIISVHQRCMLLDRAICVWWLSMCP